MKFKKETIALVCIMVVGLFLRFFQIGENPASMYWDEVAIALDAYSIGQTGRDINQESWFQPILKSYGDFKAPIFIWLVTLSVKIWGVSEFSVRLPIVFFSGLTILVSYFLTKEILALDKKLTEKYPYLALITTFIIAINPWSVHFGRIGLESSLSVFWLLLSLYLFLKGIKGSSWLMILSILTAGLGIYTYYSLRLIIPILFFLVGLVFIKKLWQKKYWAIVAILLFGLINIPLYKSPYYKISQKYRLNNDNLIHASKVIEESSKYLEKYNSNLFSKIVYHRYSFWLRDFARNYFSHLSLDFLFFSGDNNLRHHSGYGGQFLLIFLPIFILGFWLMGENIKSKTIWVILIIIFVSPIPSAMVYESPHASRAIYLFFPLSVIIALGIHYVVSLGKKWLSILIFILVFTNLNLFYLDYFIDYPERSANDWIYAYSQMAKSVKNNYQRFSDIKVSEKYWMPTLYLYYEFPDLLLKEAKDKFNINTFNSLIANRTDTLNNKFKARYLSEDDKIEDNYILEEQFYFPDGRPSLKLVVSK